MTDREIKLIKLMSKMNKKMAYYTKHPAKRVDTTMKRVSEIICLMLEFNNLRSQPIKPYANGGIIVEPNYKILPNKATPQVRAVLNGEINE